MSKGGGAGKVYFVLYLAVVLELLIIIVERDEAEEHLHKKTREAMRIVESILSQLQSGAGTEGINTRPQDEITLPPPGIDIKAIFGAELKSYRKYIVEVGVTDVSTSLARREFETEKEYIQRIQKLVELANVEQIQYQIFYSRDDNPSNAPPFPSEAYFKERNMDFLKMTPGEKISGEVPDVEWEFLGAIELNLDKEATFNKINFAEVNMQQISPIYPNERKRQVGPIFAPPNMPDDSIFFYSGDDSMNKISGATNLQRRSFVVNFQPPNQAGWYKLRFESRTNRILGVKSGQKAEEVSDDATVNIGTVQLTVKDLKKVKKELTMRLDKFSLPSLEELDVNGDITNFNKKLAEAKMQAASEDNAETVIGNINLYDYIVKLLAPGQSINFDQNRGSIEFNIRVVTPKPTISEPTIAMPTYLPSFDEVPAVFEFAISPFQPQQNELIGVVRDRNGNTVARIQMQPLDEIAGLGYSIPEQGQSRPYRGIVDKELAPGKYEVELSHRLAGRNFLKKMELEIFPTGLTEQSLTNLRTRMTSFAYYGYPLIFNVEPSSGGKIPAKDFKILVKTDANNQYPEINGLSMGNDYGFYFTPDAKEVKLRILWVQPLTNREVDLFPETAFAIRQEEPSIRSQRLRVEPSGPITKIRVVVTGLSVSKPSASRDQFANVAMSIAGAINMDGLKGFAAITEPMLDGDADGNYRMEFEISGKLERGETKVRGEITVPVSAIATNPINGVRSAPSTQNVRIQIDYEPQREGQRRPSGGGLR